MNLAQLTSAPFSSSAPKRVVRHSPARPRARIPVEDAVRELIRLTELEEIAYEK